MDFIKDIDALEALYPEAPPATSLEKVTPVITPCYRAWIAAARFCILTTVGPEGTDASPRGDDGPVVRILDPRTLAMPDWKGNNRLDSLRNIVTDGRVSLLFLVPGALNVVRVNGTARLSTDQALRDSFAREGKTPRSVVVITTSEVYFQCAKAIIRSGLWSGRDDSAQVPTAGEFIREFKAGFDAASYDKDYPAYAEPRLW